MLHPGPIWPARSSSMPWLRASPVWTEKLFGVHRVRGQGVLLGEMIEGERGREPAIQPLGLEAGLVLLAGLGLERLTGAGAGGVRAAQGLDVTPVEREPRQGLID
jgi:hypothetical protein